MAMSTTTNPRTMSIDAMRRVGAGPDVAGEYVDESRSAAVVMRTSRSARRCTQRFVDLLATPAAHRHARSISQHHVRLAARLYAHFTHTIEIDDRGPMHTDETDGIESRLERRQGFSNEVTSPARVDRGVI